MYNLFSILILYWNKEATKLMWNFFYNEYNPMCLMFCKISSSIENMLVNEWFTEAGEGRERERGREMSKFRIEDILKINVYRLLISVTRCKQTIGMHCFSFENYSKLLLFWYMKNNLKHFMHLSNWNFLKNKNRWRRKNGETTKHVLWLKNKCNKEFTKRKQTK